MRTTSDTRLEAVALAYHRGVTHVWLHRRIEQDEEGMWHADEAHGTMPGRVSQAAIERRFDALWDEFDPPEPPTADEIGDAIAELSDVVSTNAMDVADLGDAIAELSEIVSDMIGETNG